jgi:hypothetical protein
MENEQNTNIVLIISWLNYFFSHLFSEPVLSKIALILSIIGSIFYIYNQIKKTTKKND